MEFNCTKCGLCCSTVGVHVEEAKKMLSHGAEEVFLQEVANFPYEYDEKGKCENLDENNLCKVYDSRPDMCSVNKIYEKHFGESFSLKEWYILNEGQCQQLIETNNFVNK